MPAVWYVAHLQGGGYDVAGATIPGLPGVIIGHNREIAWGVTAGMVDAEDLLIERDLVGARRLSEKIEVRGGEAVLEEIVISRHGPVISGTLSIPKDGAVLALRSVLHDFRSPTSALLRLNRAHDWESFLDALREWHFPSLNFVYADRSGSIGYKLAGQVPIRAGPAIGVPSPGWDGTQAWNAFVPFEAMPQEHNPAEGILATANSRPPSGISHFLGADWCDDGRWRRIMELLRARRRHDLDSLVRIQADQRSMLALAVVERVLGRIRARDTIETTALERLRSWDGGMGPESVAASIASVLSDELVRALNADLDESSLAAILGRGLDQVLSPLSGFYFRRSSNLLAQLDSAADEKVQQAFESATGRLRRWLGEEVEGWRWGRIHKVRFTHPIGAAAPLIDRFFRLSRGPLPIGGDTDTIAQAGVNPWHPYEATGFTVSYRQLFDLSDWDKARYCLPTGQSGHPGSRHYDDMLEDWRKVSYRSLPFSRAAVDSQAEERISLRPPETSRPEHR
jgi:penicillin amidase